MWEISSADQTLTFLYGCVVGIILCLFYDIIRALRKAGINSNISVFIADVFFWLVSAVLTFIFFMATTNGEIRGYVLAAELIGFILCRFTVSLLLFPVFRFLICNLVLVIRKISFYTALFCEKSEQFLYRFIKFCSKKIKRTIKSIKKLLKSVWQMLYTKGNNLDLELGSDDTEKKA